MIVSFGRPYLAAASDGLLTVFFGMGDETFGGDDGAGAVVGDDGVALLRGIDAYVSLDAGFGVVFSCFTATGTT